MKSKSYLLAILCSLIIGTCTHALEAKNRDTSINREEDLKVILEQTFLKEDRFDKLATMYVTQRFDQGEHTIPVESIIKRLRQAVQTKESLKQLMKPYSVFSDDEIHQLREIVENEAFQKYMEQSFSILKANRQAMDNALNAILQQGFEFEMPSPEHVESPKENKQEDSEILKITKDNFPEEVEESTQLVILDVYANWCRPCHEFASTFEDLHQKYKEECKFGKVNSNEESLLVSFLKVKAYPTTVFIHNGKVVSREVGNMSKEKLEAKIQDLLKDIE